MWNKMVNSFHQFLREKASLLMEIERSGKRRKYGVEDISSVWGTMCLY